jgi:hypothetical protein
MPLALFNKFLELYGAMLEKVIVRVTRRPLLRTRTGDPGRPEAHCLGVQLQPTIRYSLSQP